MATQGFLPPQTTRNTLGRRAPHACLSIPLMYYQKNMRDNSVLWLHLLSCVHSATQGCPGSRRPTEHCRSHQDRGIPESCNLNSVSAVHTLKQGIKQISCCSCSSDYTKEKASPRSAAESASFYPQRSACTKDLLRKQLRERNLSFTKNRHNVISVLQSKPGKCLICFLHCLCLAVQNEQLHFCIVLSHTGRLKDFFCVCSWLTLFLGFSPPQLF